MGLAFRLSVPTLLLSVACGDDREALEGGADAGGTRVTSECGVEEQFVVTRADHVAGTVDYAESPPVGGDHSDCWAAWAVHQDVVSPERWVHNLEHGGVVFLHDCADGCPGDEANLAEVLAFAAPSAHPRILATPYPGLPGRFAAVSWGRRLVLSCIDVQAVADFYTLRVANGESPENFGTPPPEGCP